MKKVFKNFVLPTLLGVLAVIVIGMGCTPTSTNEDEEDDRKPETDFEVASPDLSAVFYANEVSLNTEV